MPVVVPDGILNLDREAFGAVDRVVMRCAFDSHNELGRLFDEQVYENDLALRLKAAGMDVRTQVPLLVTFEGYSTEYRLDLVVNGAIYELKVVGKLVSKHDAQILHYAMLMDVSFGKLLNFRNASVEGLLKGNAFRDRERWNLNFNETKWREESDRCGNLKIAMEGLLADWGGCLSISLYTGALVYLMGGEEKCLKRVPIQRVGRELGTHLVQCHADRTAFVLTSMTGSLRGYEVHLRRQFGLTDLKAVQWINLNRCEIEFITIAL